MSSVSLLKTSSPDSLTSSYNGYSSPSATERFLGVTNRHYSPPVRVTHPCLGLSTQVHRLPPSTVDRGGHRRQKVTLSFVIVPDCDFYPLHDLQTPPVTSRLYLQCHSCPLPFVPSNHNYGPPELRGELQLNCMGLKEVHARRHTKSVCHLST